MNTAQQIKQALETYESLAFLTKSLEGDNESVLARIRHGLKRTAKRDHLRLLRSLRADIDGFRAHYGAIAPNHKYRALLRDARSRLGYSYLPKAFIDSELFRSYDRVFPRWPHVPLHALVVFDGQTNRSVMQIFTLEGAVYDDVRFLISQAQAVHKGIGTRDFRSRSPEDQRALSAYVRFAAGGVFQFLEAYLNGVAYDCFHTYHDRLSLADHDCLAEWDSKSKRVRYVSFERKLFEYPEIVGRMVGRTVRRQTFKGVRLLDGYGKRLRDALTHPSAYVHVQSGEQEKVSLAVTVNLDIAESLFAAAKDYVLGVETCLGRDPTKTMPWLPT